MLRPEFFFLVGGALLLSILHAAIPNHWLPFVILQREQGWSRARLLYVTGVAGFAHVTSTVLIGIVVGLAGTGLSAAFGTFFDWVGPAILVGLGLWLVCRRGGHHHDHSHHNEHARRDTADCHVPNEDRENHSHSEGHGGHGTRPENVVTLGGLVVMMFFSPCLELEAYYLPAGRWLGILAVSAIFLVVTVTLMLFLVCIASAGVRRLHWDWLERRESLVNGSVLIVVGVVWKLLRF